MELKEWIQDSFTPAVMVISSPEVEALCQESNGLNIVDLLRPFGLLQQLSGELYIASSYRQCTRTFKHQASVTSTVLVEIMPGI